MQKCVIRTTAGDPRQKNWQILIFNNQLMNGIFLFIKTYKIYFEQYIHKVVFRFFFCLVYGSILTNLQFAKCLPKAFIILNFSRRNISNVMILTLHFEFSGFVVKFSRCVF